MISKEDLQGSWQLESWTIGYSDRDDFTYPFGEDPQGLLLYTNDGWVSASIARHDRALLPEDVNFRKIPDRLKADAFASYFHYAGHAELDGQTLVLSAKDQAGDVVRFHSLVWHRLAATEEHELIDSE